MKPNISSFPIDSRMLAHIFSDEAIFGVADQLGTAFLEAHTTDALWSKLLAGVGEQISAPRGTVLIARTPHGKVEPVAFRGTPTEVNRELAAQALRQNFAIFTPAVICVPMHIGAIHVESNPDKPFTIDDLHQVIAISREAFRIAPLVRRAESLEDENKDLKDFNYVNQGIIGNSAQMLEVHKFIATFGPRETTLLILGESGTGKDLVARAIHSNSPRSEGPFVALNCAAFPEHLIATELFGHEEGAFTGAHKRKKGKIEAADGGTIFLDEVGELKPDEQAALLRVLESRELQRVGGNETIHVNIRIIAATNRDLKKLVASGQFREELYYRLNVVVFTTPPLRDRREDISLLARHFVKKFSTRSHPVTDLSGNALTILCNYDWPGNVRELQNIIEAAVARATSEIIQVENLSADIREAAGVNAPRTGLDEAVFAFKRSFVLRVLEEVGWDIAAAADELGIARQSLYRLAGRLGIDLTRSDSETSRSSGDSVT